MKSPSPLIYSHFAPLIIERTFTSSSISCQRQRKPKIHAVFKTWMHQVFTFYHSPGFSFLFFTFEYFFCSCLNTELIFFRAMKMSDNDFSISFLSKNRGYHCAGTLIFFLCMLPSIYPQVLSHNLAPSH